MTDPTTDSEEFCDYCWAGMESPEHHEKCVIPQRAREDELAEAEFLPSYEEGSVGD